MRQDRLCVAIGPRAGLVAYLMKLLGRIRCLVYEDVDYEPGLVVPRVRQLLLAKLETYLMKRADLVVSVGRGLAQLRRRESGREVSIVSNGVNVDAFSSARERSSHAPTLVYSGNVTYWSGLDVVISRSEEHTSELQSPCNLVCRLLLEKKKTNRTAAFDRSTGPSTTELFIDTM